MPDTIGFGLAVVKREGGSYQTDGKATGMDDCPDLSRWIELCYDPKEDMSHIDLESCKLFFEDIKFLKGYTDDDIYLIIAALANEFIPKGF